MHPQKQCPAYGLTCSRCGKMNYYKAINRNAQRQKQSQKPPQRNKSVHDIQDEEESYTGEQEEKSRNFDLVNIRYLKF